MTFYDVLKKACQKKKTSPCAVALSIGMSKSNVTAWKRGDRSPRLDVVIKLAGKLGVSPESLVKGVTVEE